jgi:hypothetical protein
MRENFGAVVALVKSSQAVASALLLHDDTVDQRRSAQYVNSLFTSDGCTGRDGQTLQAQSQAVTRQQDEGWYVSVSAIGLQCACTRPVMSSQRRCAEQALDSRQQCV